MFGGFVANSRSPYATLKADDTSWGWNVGALFNVSDETKVGVSYRSTVKQELEGSLTVDGNPSLAANADVELPDTFSYSASATSSIRNGNCLGTFPGLAGVA